ncbi:hypothetical protein QVD99_000712 [Batrachochytrium dendrobatidis]|nr:hypothetical protein O5D80_003563 [Batrachochytrium dendrobatidis]KAK5673257.1 hypothetical protein QVD99_000712 [Batrachochytrium dendrobatidis]
MVLGDSVTTAASRSIRKNEIVSSTNGTSSKKNTIRIPLSSSSTSKSTPAPSIVKLTSTTATGRQSQTVTKRQSFGNDSRHLEKFQQQKQPHRSLEFGLKLRQSMATLDKEGSESDSDKTLPGEDVRKKQSLVTTKMTSELRSARSIPVLQATTLKQADISVPVKESTLGKLPPSDRSIRSPGSTLLPRSSNSFKTAIKLSKSPYKESSQLELVSANTSSTCKPIHSEQSQSETLDKSAQDAIVSQKFDSTPHKDIEATLQESISIISINPESTLTNIPNPFSECVDFTGDTIYNQSSQTEKSDSFIKQTCPPVQAVILPQDLEVEDPFGLSLKSNARRPVQRSPVIAPLAQPSPTIKLSPVVLPNAPHHEHDIDSVYCANTENIYIAPEVSKNPLMDVLILPAAISPTTESTYSSSQPLPITQSIEKTQNSLEFPVITNQIPHDNQIEKQDDSKDESKSPTTTDAKPNLVDVSPASFSNSRIHETPVHNIVKIATQISPKHSPRSHTDHLEVQNPSFSPNRFAESISKRDLRQDTTYSHPVQLQVQHQARQSHILNQSHIHSRHDHQSLQLFNPAAEEQQNTILQLESRLSDALRELDNAREDYVRVYRVSVQSDQQHQDLLDQLKSEQELISQQRIDIDELTNRLKHEKTQNERHEADFRLFSHKIHTQQDRISELMMENETLKSSLRKLQYESVSPTQVTTNESFYRERLEHALYDNESLKLMISRMRSDGGHSAGSNSLARESNTLCNAWDEIPHQASRATPTPSILASDTQQCNIDHEEPEHTTPSSSRRIRATTAYGFEDHITNPENDVNSRSQSSLSQTHLSCISGANTPYRSGLTEGVRVKDTITPSPTQSALNLNRRASQAWAAQSPSTESPGMKLPLHTHHHSGRDPTSINLTSRFAAVQSGARRFSTNSIVPSSPLSHEADQGHHNDRRTPVGDWGQRDSEHDSSGKSESLLHEFISKRKTLDKELRSLSEEKSRLTFELSRIPASSGGGGNKSRKRLDEIEESLDVVDRKMAAVRKQMKQIGIL